MTFDEFKAALVKAGKLKEETKPAEEKSAKCTSKDMEEAKAVFDKLAGDDGKVSLMEFFKSSNNELLKGMNFSDAAGDDKQMTFDEFKAALVKSGKLEEETKPAEEKPAKCTSKDMEEAKAVFDKLAGDDGKVSLMEFFKSSNNELLKGMDFAEAAGDDKKMTFDEFKAALVKAGKLEEEAKPDEKKEGARRRRRGRS